MINELYMLSILWINSLGTGHNTCLPDLGTRSKIHNVDLNAESLFQEGIAIHERCHPGHAVNVPYGRGPVGVWCLWPEAQDPTQNDSRQTVGQTQLPQWWWHHWEDAQLLQGWGVWWEKLLFMQSSQCLILCYTNHNSWYVKTVFW